MALGSEISCYAKDLGLDFKFRVWYLRFSGLKFIGLYFRGLRLWALACEDHGQDNYMRLPALLVQSSACFVMWDTRTTNTIPGPNRRSTRTR